VETTGVVADSIAAIAVEEASTMMVAADPGDAAATTETIKEEEVGMAGKTVGEGETKDGGVITGEQVIKVSSFALMTEC